MHPHIHIITTGGTIAMQQDASAGGAIPKLTGQDFMRALPHVEAEVEVDEYCNLPSAHFTVDTIWGLRGRVAAAVEQPDVDGVVITHGTDVMEETAYLLDLTVDSDKPVVVTGAMRNASEVGYEGLANLAAAVRAAASPACRGLGTLVVMNDEIHAARHVTKTHTLSLDTFKSPGCGPLGRVDGDRVVVARRVARAPIPTAALEPRISLIRLAVGVDEGWLRYAVQQGARGVVIEGLGGGRVPPWWMPLIRQTVADGVTVVIASRCPAGRVYDAYGYAGAHREQVAAGCLFAEGLNGQKARIRLMVVLGTGPRAREIGPAWYRGLKEN